jgi:hypothetical protein
MDPPSPPLPPPLAPREEILACRLSSWYATFRGGGSGSGRRWRNCTIRSAVLGDLPPAFLRYLLSDGVRLPEGAERLSSCAPEGEDGGWSSSDDHDHDHDHEEDEDDGGIGIGSGGGGGGEEERPSFPELNSRIEEALADLGGAALPKLSWSAPRDATWLNGGTMRCETPGDVYLLLKSSDFVMHGLLHPFDGGNGGGDGGGGTASSSSVRHDLVLRKWSHLHPSQEFRCFVSDRTLLAISQRHHSQRYPHLGDGRERFRIRSSLVAFFGEYVRDRFAGGTVPRYSFDTYLDREGRVWLIDFNPWSGRTDPLLFGWEELIRMAGGGDPDGSDGQDGSGDEDEDEDEDGEGSEEEGKAGEREDEEEDEEDEEEGMGARPILRIVETEREVRPDPLSSYRAPIDTVDLAGDLDGATSFARFMEMCERPSDLGQEAGPDLE